MELILKIKEKNVEQVPFSSDGGGTRVYLRIPEKRVRYYSKISESRSSMQRSSKRDRVRKRERESCV